MIYTLTINPSVDLVMDLKAPLTLGVINRSGHEGYNIGGKGINVATVLNNLGEDVTPVTILAGFTGREIESYLKIYDNLYSDGKNNDKDKKDDDIIISKLITYENVIFDHFDKLKIIAQECDFYI